MNLKKLSSVVLSAVMLSSLIVGSAMAESKNFNEKNLSERSLNVSELARTNKLVIASENSYADALSAYNVMLNNKAALITVKDNTDVESVIRKYEKNIGKKVIEVAVVGGENTISESIFNRIKAVVPDTYRIAGPNRYYTNIRSLEASKVQKVAVADGRQFPDALSVSGLMSKYDCGLLLVDGSKSYKTDYNVIYTVGGKKSVKQDGGKRLAGSDRYGTNEAINKEIGRLETVAVANGESYINPLIAQNVVIANKNSGIVLSSNRGLTKGLAQIFKDAVNKYIIGENNLNEIKSTSVAPVQKAKDLVSISKDSFVDKYIKLRVPNDMKNVIKIKLEPKNEVQADSPDYPAAYIETTRVYNTISGRDHLEIYNIALEKHYNPNDRDRAHQISLGTLTVNGKSYHLNVYGGYPKVERSELKDALSTIHKVDVMLLNNLVGINGAKFTPSKALIDAVKNPL